ncbi:FAD-binding protein [Bradyrhizobium sp. CCBAU 051011]|uniref:FAD-binding protein n=1 Tax=Bradyrhizobium sp. CCBAU 051011 TaxID=858422 RepID=UPI00137A5701|nr:FAD-binding protein [Bradyrhizobium sp. CCBAU 051011]
MKTYTTDVLIVGGGGAATAAAISAHESGARTILAVKGRFGVPGLRGAGATSNPLADFWTIRTVGPKGGLFNPPDLVHQDMIQAGLGMADAELCRIYVDEAPEAIKRLRAMGVQFQNKVLAVMPAVAASSGTNNIVAIQKAVIEHTKTTVLEHANVIDMLVEAGRCFGAVGIDDWGEPFLVRAGAVVLATGGVGQLFRYSFNPPGNTGDGYAMVLRAGAELFNMEFMQQGLATTWPSQAMVMLYDMPEPFRLFNRDGKSFVQQYLLDGVTLEEVSRCKALHWPVSCRDAAIHLDRAIHGEALAGRAGPHDGVYLDLSLARRAFLPEMFVNYMAQFDIDLNRDLLQVQNHHHTCNGGARVDSHGETRVRGLFAAGETMGYQGADRLGGTMLGGSQVFGFRAGRKAAEVAREEPDLGVHSGLLDRLLHEPLARLAEAKGPARPGDLLRPLQQKMWAELLVEKDEESLARALQYVADDRERLATGIRTFEPMDCMLALEHRNLLDIAEVIIRAAMLRTESRGSHYRADYPDRNDADWLTNIFAALDDGQLRLETRRTDRTWFGQAGDLRILPWG